MKGTPPEGKLAPTLKLRRPSTTIGFQRSSTTLSCFACGDHHDHRTARYRVNVWAKALEARRGYWKTVVAIAAKNARMAWAVLRKGEEFQYPS